MQALEAHGKTPKPPRHWGLVAGVVVLCLAVAGGAYAFGRSRNGSESAGGSHGSTNTPTSTTTTKVATRQLQITSSTPAAGASAVSSDSTISISFSSPIVLGKTQPTVSPLVAGTWRQDNASTIEFVPAAPLIPSTTMTVSIPGGKDGIKGSNGSRLNQSSSFQFAVAAGSMLRLQQILAQLNYLPLSFTPSNATTENREMAMDQPGTFAWRWATLPADLTSLWIQGSPNIISKAAIITFEHDNGLTVDGLEGPMVWTALLQAAAAGAMDPNPYNYVYVSKVIPENLTLYSNGAVQLSDIPVNTGAPGADTADGTFPVFEHVVASEMKGTNPDGSTYDDPNVPWASFFNGGDALHGFVRAKYGYPQSNGCVEMSIANAAVVWPLTPIGTLVTVVGPAVT
jgi:peptidoglycan hydrolase-like protein with peptidoglycan-binding domain